jgi:hypothetical protein
LLFTGSGFVSKLIQETLVRICYNNLIDLLKWFLAYGEQKTMHPSITKIIACRVVIEEILPLLPEAVNYETLDFGLHVNPDELRKAIQAKIDASNNGKGMILLGYGLCSRAVVGLRSENCALVVPRVDDCIGIFLGSRQAYLRQMHAEPGTYYLTKGWIEAGHNPFGLYNQMAERYGAEKAEWLISRMLKNYTRLVFIDTGQYEAEHYREYSKRMASRYGLRFEEIDGSTALVAKMINGPWDEDFVVVPPNQTIPYETFYGSTI